jgi:hypothetical protein
MVYSKLEDQEGFDQEANKKWSDYMIPFDGDVRNTGEIL